MDPVRIAGLPKNEPSHRGRFGHDFYQCGGTAMRPSGELASFAVLAISIITLAVANINSLPYLLVKTKVRITNKTFPMRKWVSAPTEV